MKSKTPEPKFIGFFPKLPCPKPEGFDDKKINEICSVSECIAKGPENWIEEWQHNELGFFDTEEKATRMPGKDCDKYCLYAYKLYPLRFSSNKVEVYSIPLNLQADLVNYDLLGYDIVSRSSSDFFECSVLSCNGLYKIYSVNQYCLIDASEDAYNYCLEIEKEKAEPGPYYLFEVYRKRLVNNSLHTDRIPRRLSGSVK